MKVNKSLLTLMIALAAGSAAAASAGTTAGTAINNVATASFDDPTTGTAATPVNSNPVTTTVTAVTGFDIIYQGSQPDGTSATTPATGTPTYDIANVLASSSTATTYTVVNNSNIDGYVINIAADTTGTGGVFQPKTPTNVKYYPAGTTNFTTTTPINSVTLAKGASVDVIQVITISGASAGDAYSASPHGTAPAGGTGTGAYTAYDENTNTNSPATTGDLEFTRVTVTTPALVVVPPTVIRGGNPPASPTAPNNPGPTPPPGLTPPTTYSPPVNTGYPNNPGTVITSDLASNNQDAYPKSDTDANADVVTFVSNVKSNGTVADTIYVKPTLPPNATSFTVLDANGNVLTAETTGPNTGQYKLPGGPVAPGSSVEYQLVVTYPDSDGLNPQANIVTPVNIYSGNVPTQAPITSTFTIHPPQLKFGDTPASGDPVSTPSPTETVDATTGTFNTTKNTITDASAVFPMTIKNTGTYGEAYTLAGSVTIVNKPGSATPTTVVPVTYYKADGTALATAGETPTIAVGGTYDLLAVINVPNTAAATTAANPAPSVSQTATGKFSGDTASDTNDLIAISPKGSISVAKTQSVTPVATGTASAYVNTALTAAPKDALNYKILATNTYNTPVYNFVLKDQNGATNGGTTGNAFTNLNYVGASVALNGFGSGKQVVYYSVDGGVTFPTTTAPTTGTFDPTKGIAVAVDTDTTAGIGAGDSVPAGATIELTVNTTVK